MKVYSRGTKGRIIHSACMRIKWKGSGVAMSNYRSWASDLSCNSKAYNNWNNLLTCCLNLIGKQNLLVVKGNVSVFPSASCTQQCIIITGLFFYNVCIVCNIHIHTEVNICMFIFKYIFYVNEDGKNLHLHIYILWTAIIHVLCKQPCLDTLRTLHLWPFFKIRFPFVLVLIKPKWNVRGNVRRLTNAMFLIKYLISCRNCKPRKKRKAAIWTWSVLLFTSVSSH